MDSNEEESGFAESEYQFVIDRERTPFINEAMLNGYVHSYNPPFDVFNCTKACVINTKRWYGDKQDFERIERELHEMTLPKLTVLAEAYLEYGEFGESHFVK